MKTIIFYYVSQSEDDPNEIFFNTNKNSRLNSDPHSGKIFFQSSSSAKEEIEVMAKPLQFDESTYELLYHLLEAARTKAPEISDEPIGQEINPGELHSVICSKVYKSSYENPKSIFEFVTDMFIALLMGHKLSNGNKRVSLWFLILTLRAFGYDLYRSYGVKKNWSTYKSKTEEFVEKLQNSNHDSLDAYDKLYKIREEIKAWVINNSIIALHWR